jgi:FkbM family methyltransferase
MHPRSYLEELKYIQAAVPSWAGRARLLAATMAFHVNNGLRRQGAGRDTLDIDLFVGDDLYPMRVRPNRGDLFILYEVLAREAYLIPAHRLDPDKVRTVIDCGANIGLTALYFANRYKHARIFSVEPDPDNFAVLQRNVAKCERIVPIRAAVVGRSGTVHMTRHRPAYGNKIQNIPEEGLTQEVPGVTIEDICSQHCIESVDLLKVDIEGAEENVFADPHFLPKVKMIAIELHAPYGLEQFRRAIAPFGFSAEVPGPNGCQHAHLATIVPS